MNLKEIKDLIELVDEKGFADFELKRKGFRLRISRFKESNQSVLQPASAPIIISSAIPGAPEVLSQGGQRALIEAPLSQASAAPTTAPADLQVSAAEPELHVIKSPIVGTFYSRPAPTSDPFVRVGEEVDPETVVCIIEAMKLMNEIQAEVRGEVVRIFVDDGQPIEYGQPLFGIKTK